MKPDREIQDLLRRMYGEHLFALVVVATAVAFALAVLMRWALALDGSPPESPWRVVAFAAGAGCSQLIAAVVVRRHLGR
jgi:hypothetical protein